MASKFGLKVLDTESGRIGGYLVAWGSPDDKDLENEYFTKASELGMGNHYPRPILYHHGLDGKMQADVIGILDTFQEDDIGLWVEGQLDLARDYVRRIFGMVQKGVLGFSSGALPHLVQVMRDGWIKRWIIVEGSLTPTPAQPRKTVITALKTAANISTYPTIEKLLTGIESGEFGTVATSDKPDVNRYVKSRGFKMDDEEMKADGAEDTTPDESKADGAEMPDESKEGEMGGGDVAVDRSGEIRNLLSLFAQYTGQTLTDEQMSELTAMVIEQTKSRFVVKSIKAVSSVQLMGMFKSDSFKAWLNNAVRNVAPLRGDGAKKLAQELAASFNSGAGGTQRGTGGKSAVGATSSGKGGYDGASASSGGQKAADVSVSTKYADLSADDMAYLHTVRQSIDSRYNPGEAFYREMADKAEREIAAKSLTVDAKGIKSIRGIKSGEVMNTGVSNYGADWIPTLWSNQIWARDRLDNVVARNLSAIDMPSNPFVIPLEGVDPTVKTVAETIDADQLAYTSAGAIPVSKTGTANVTITAGKLVVRTAISGEEDEDAIIPVVSQQRNQMTRALQDAIDYVLINADNNTSGNINYDGGSPAATDKFMYGGGDGIFMLPLVDDTGQAIDAGNAAPDLAMLRRLRYKLLAPYRQDKANLMYLIDSESEGVMLNIPELKDYFYRGNPGSAVTGEVARIDNIPVYVSNEILPSASNGKVSSTGGNNTQGRVSIVHRPSFRYGYRRQLRLASVYDPFFDAHMLVATVRVGLVRKDDKCAALLYNIAVGS